MGKAFVQVILFFLNEFVWNLVLKFDLNCFSQIFGEHNEDEDVAPDREDPEAAGDAAGVAALEKESNKDVSHF